jgi:GDP-4-dehydro-6-deoxy-D-mannose reductase
MVYSLITGAAGMMGTHLYETLKNDGEDVLATYLLPTIDERDPILQDLKDNHLELDLLDYPRVVETLNTHRPTVIYHLAAQSRPDVSFDKVGYTIDTNVQGTVNLLDACRELDYKPKIVNASSSAVYGDIDWTEPPDEDAPTRPMSPYGTSKLAQEHLMRNYAQMGHIEFVNVRIFNCTGPRKTSDFVSDIVRRVIKDDLPIRVGNITGRRSIVDVRDLVKGLIKAQYVTQLGKTINLGSSACYKISDVLDLILAGRDYYVDESLLRATDEKVIYGNINNAKGLLRWDTEISLQKTIGDTFDYWRSLE